MRIVVTTQTNITGGPQFGTSYDFTESCPRCGTGATPVGPRFLKIKHAPKHSVFQTLDGEILISSELAEALASIGAAFLSEVRDATSHQLLPFFEIRAEAELPPFSEGTTGFEKERSCVECQRDGYFKIPEVPLRLAFPPINEKARCSNVLATFERFGNSRLRRPIRDSVFARPVFLISSRLRDAIRDLRIEGVSFDDVSFG